MRNMHVIPEVKLMMSALKLVALVRLLMVVAILSLGYCSFAKADPSTPETKWAPHGGQFFWPSAVED